VAKLIRFALRQRFLIVFLSLGVVALGLWALSALKIEAYPDISEIQVVVITLYPGHAAEEVELQVSVSIERALNSVPNVIARRSRSIFGLSVVDLTFEYGTNEYLARQVVLEKLRDAALPEGIEPTLAPPTTPAGELYRYALEGGTGGSMQLRELQDWVIAPRLLQVAGVGDVFAFGGLVKQYQIEVDPLGLYKYNLTIKQIAAAVGANNQDGGGSLLRSGEQAMVVRGVGLIRTIGDIENIVVASVRGAPVFIRDVARVRVGPAPPNGVFGLDGESDRVEGVVVMRRGENPSEVLRGVREAIEELNGAWLPDGVRIVPIYDRTGLVHNTLGTVSRTLAEGLIIVFLVLFFLLGSLRAAVLTAVIIPLSLLFAFGCMYFYGIPASLLSLGAIDFGIIVDGTLVMVEYIVTRLALQPAGQDARRRAAVIESAAVDIHRPILFSLLILITAYLPLFTLERAEGRLFTPMAFTIAAALAGSLLFSFTLVPVLAAWLFGREWKEGGRALVGRLAAPYERALRFSMRRPGQVAAASVLLFAATAVLAGRLGSEFLPQLDEGVIWIRVNLPAGVALEKSAEIAGQIRALLLQSPQVARVASQTGRQGSNTEPFGPNRTELLVVLRPYSTWPAGKTKADLVKELSADLNARIPGAAFTFTQPIIDMVMDALTGSSADLAVILSGPDLEVLRRTADQVLGVLRQVNGAADTAIEQEADQAQLRIRIDRGEAARHGINVTDIQEVIELAIGGRPVSTLFEGDRRFDIVVRYVPEARSTLNEIGNMLVPAPDGSRLPLSRLAEIKVVNGASIVARRENRRLISVRTNIRGRDQGSFVAEAQQKFNEQITLPSGYRVEWGGQFENLARARKRLAWILPITVLLIFALLYWTFGSARMAALVLATVPFSVVGGIVALHLRGIPFSVSAAVGFVSLFGVAVMSGVLYVTRINRQRAESPGPLTDAIASAACLQLRPILVLIVVAMLGMVPAAFARGIGSDIQRPLATVVLGGLISTLVLTLLALPTLYYLVERGREKKQATSASA